MSQLLSQFTSLARCASAQLLRNTPFNALANPANCLRPPTTSWSLNSVRTRCENFKPGENKRVKVLGYHAKVKTRKGRLQIMRRILKGRFVLTH